MINATDILRKNSVNTVFDAGNHVLGASVSSFDPTIVNYRVGLADWVHEPMTVTYTNRIGRLMRIGNWFHVTIQLTVTWTIPALPTYFGIELPFEMIEASVKGGAATTSTNVIKPQDVNNLASMFVTGGFDSVTAPANTSVIILNMKNALNVDSQIVRCDTGTNGFVNPAVSHTIYVTTYGRLNNA